MRIEWSGDAVTSAARFMKDRAGMLAVNAAVNALTGDPEPAEGFHRDIWHRLPVGPYRVKYFIDGDVITIDRVDKVAG